MAKRYLLIAIGILFLSNEISLIIFTDNIVYAGEMEAIVKDNTVNSGFSVKEQTTNSTIARFRGDGNVGIGTTNPTEKLEVNGNIKITGTGNGIKFPDGTAQTTAATSGNPTNALIDVSIFYTSGSNSTLSAVMVAAVPSTGKVFLRSLESRDAISLDNLAAWGEWIDFGAPEIASMILDVSVSLSTNSGNVASNSDNSIVIVARMSSGTIYLRSLERRDSANYDNPNVWGTWVSFGSPGM
ncbi:MAG: hypothetical protein ACUZ8E_01795 [Candidatus Anammoxibacter sp.]